MRVLHLASWHPNRVHPQLGNFVRRHIEALPEEVESTVLHAWPDPGRRLNRREIEDRTDAEMGVRTVTAYVPDRAPRLWRIERAYTRLCERLGREGTQPDIVHLHNAAEAALPAVEFADSQGIPLVVSENWTAYHAEHGRAFRAKEERAVRKALQAAVLHMPVSEHLGRAMADFAPDVQQTVVPNVVADHFRTGPHERSEGVPLRLLHVSSMVDDHKNIRGMLRAVATAVQAGAELELTCHGGAGAGGSEIPGYRTLAEELGLASRVSFEGPAAAEEVANAMRRADAFVLFSRYENLPCVILEAWSTGLPVIATEVGGVGEHLGGHPELGALIASEDEAALTAAIVGMAEAKKQGQRPDALAIAAYAEDRFSMAAVGRQIVEAYRSVLG